MNKKVQSELERVQNLLQEEKTADFERFREEVAKLTQAQRREKGLCWYPLVVLKTGYTIGERAFVTVERTAHLDRPHRLKSGMPIEFYAGQEVKNKDNTERGIIHFINKNKMKIILNSKDLPDWLNEGHLAVDMLFDERTYLEMERAMKIVIKAKDDRLEELKALFYGDAIPEYNTLPNVHHEYLNEAQQNAVQHILAAKDVAVVHGPPGTGKTTTLVHAIKLMAAHEKNILVTASSNAAVDLLVERLAKQGLLVVRVGNISRVNDKLVEMTLEGRLSSHPESKNIKRLRIQAANARREAKRFKRKFGSKERQDRNDAWQEARELESYAKMLEERLLSEILMSADVIACTLVNTVNSVLEKVKFKTVIIDEAAQALEPATWIPITKVKRVVLAGDPYQLSPVVKSIKAQREGFGQTLLEKWVARGKTVSFLDTQYRMHPSIVGFSNSIFYKNQLVTAKNVENTSLGIQDLPHLVFIDTAGCGFNEMQNPESKSRYNEGEAFILREYFLQFIEKLSQAKLENVPSIGIITPYQAQAKHISQMLQDEPIIAPYLEYVTVNSVDAFQGQERDVIFISLTRSNEKAEIGFLSDYRRMNVAMTRAKKHLVVIGDGATIGGDDFYTQFMDYVEKNGNYQSAWEYMS